MSLSIVFFILNFFPELTISPLIDGHNLAKIIRFLVNRKITIVKYSFFYIERILIMHPPVVGPDYL